MLKDHPEQCFKQTSAYPLVKATAKYHALQRLDTNTRHGSNFGSPFEEFYVVVKLWKYISGVCVCVCKAARALDRHRPIRFRGRSCDRPGR